MKNADENFGDMLSSCPFDDSNREEHRREVRERAMRAFDESAATPMLTVAAGEETPQRWTRRSYYAQNDASCVPLRRLQLQLRPRCACADDLLDRLPRRAKYSYAPSGASLTNEL